MPGYSVVGTAAGGPGGSGGGALPPSAIAGLKLWLRADQGTAFGGMAVPVHYAGTGPAPTRPTGTPVATVQSIEVDITFGGALGTSQFRWLLNGVVQATNVATAANVVLGTTGVTWTFAAGAYVVGDVYTSVPVVSSWTSIDGSATVFLQATLANMPAYIAAGGSPASGWSAGPNNQATLLFAAGQTLAATGFGSLPQPYTAFVVGQLTSAPSGNQFLLSDSGFSAFIAYASTSGEANATADGGAHTVGILGQAQATHPFILAASFNGNATRCPATQGGACPMGSGATAVGLVLGGTTGNYFAGQLPEVFLHGSQLSVANANSLAQYLSARYAV